MGAEAVALLREYEEQVRVLHSILNPKPEKPKRVRYLCVASEAVFAPFV